LQDPDQYTTEDVKTGLNEYRLALANLIRRHADEYAAVIGLTSLSPQFEQDLVDAFQWCHWMHLEATDRKPISDIRKRLLRVKREAIEAESSLSRFRDALNDLPPRYRELLDGRLESVAKVAVSLVARQQPWFHALSSVAELAGMVAEILTGTNKGGRPKMLAFDALVRVLARAYKRATNKSAKATWNEHHRRFSGKFVSLVEAALPLATRWAGTPEKQMRFPKSANARGHYIYELTRRGRAKKPRKRQRLMPKTPPRTS
jgi:hypothetical protein